MTLSPFPVLLASLSAAMLAAGCGSQGSSSSSTPNGGTAKSTPAQSAPAGSASGSPGSTSGAVKLEADPSGALKFTTTKLQAKAGKVTIKMTNPSSVPHSIAVEGNGVDEDSTEKQVTGGQAATVTATLKPGRYSFYCPVDGHEQAGMKGTLIVN